jgi:hypothetical protein
MKITHLGQILLSSFLVRLLITGASIGDALALMGLGAVYGIHIYLDAKKIPDPNIEHKARIDSLENKIQLLESKLGVMTLGGRR